MDIFIIQLWQFWVNVGSKGKKNPRNLGESRLSGILVSFPLNRSCRLFAGYRYSLFFLGDAFTRTM